MGYKQDMGVHPSYAVERWAYYRENTHRYFRLSARNVALGGVFLVLIPTLVYQSVVQQQVSRVSLSLSSWLCTVAHVAHGLRYRSAKMLPTVVHSVDTGQVANSSD
jgi:hypothetical protein